MIYFFVYWPLIVNDRTLAGFRAEKTLFGDRSNNEYLIINLVPHLRDWGRKEF